MNRITEKKTVSIFPVITQNSQCHFNGNVDKTQVFEIKRAN